MTVIDTHTHILCQPYLDLLRERGGPEYTIQVDRSGGPALHRNGAPFMTLTPGMLDVESRIAAMNAAGVDLAILSLTTPNALWGDRETSKLAAQISNDSIADLCRVYPDRFRGLASLPWGNATDALAELDRASDELGLVGVITLANIDGAALTDPAYALIWEALNQRGLPVLVHPTTPPGMEAMQLDEYNLAASVGFLIDTTLAITRMIFSGFFDRYPAVKIIAPHAGGTLPYIVGRLDRCYEQMPACRTAISARPSTYLQRIYYDAVCFSPDALDLCLRVSGSQNLLYGSDYPHNVGDIAGCLALVDRLPPNVATAVRSQNAERLFRL